MPHTMGAIVYDTVIRATKEFKVCNIEDSVTLYLERAPPDNNHCRKVDWACLTEIDNSLCRGPDATTDKRILGDLNSFCPLPPKSVGSSGIHVSPYILDGFNP